MKKLLLILPFLVGCSENVDAKYLKTKEALNIAEIRLRDVKSQIEIAENKLSRTQEAIIIKSGNANYKLKLRATASRYVYSKHQHYVNTNVAFEIPVSKEYYENIQEGNHIQSSGGNVIVQDKRID